MATSGTGIAITTAGNFGVGTSSPTSLLHVNGNTRIEGTATIITSGTTAIDIAGYDSSLRLTSITVGAGLDFSSGSLTAEGLINSYSSSATWTKPSGCKTVTASAWGAGGGGSGGSYIDTGSGSGGGGGGAGGYSSATFDCASISFNCEA